jgi:RND family efflux transporter MFP subunit
MKNIFLSLILSVLIGSCDVLTETNQEQINENQDISNKVIFSDTQFKNAEIVLGELSKKTISHTLIVNGMIDVPPQNLISISIPIGGFVKHTDMIQGLKVKKGNILAVIENPDFIQFQQEYLDTQSKLEYAQAEFQRQTEMKRENVTSDKLVQLSTADFKSLQTRLKALEQHIKTIGINIEQVKKGNITNQISISAPISGYVTTVNVNIGKHISPAEVLFEIVNIEHLHAELNVFERDIPKLKVGQRVRVMLGNETHEHEGEVFLINHKINADRTVNVHVHFDAKGEEMMPKTYIKGMIETGNQLVWALPEQAFILSEGKEYVFVYIGGNQQSAEHEFEMLEVKKGMSEGGFAEVILPANIDLQGKKLVIKGAFTILAKMKNIEEEE